MVPPKPGVAGSLPDGWEPAKLALQEFSGWVKNADSKVTVVAASFGVSLTLAITQIVPAMGRVLAIGGCVAQIWAGLLLAFVAAAVCTGTGIFMALVPRTPSAEANRFSWPDHATGAVVAATLNCSTEAAVADAWKQARALAVIGAEKFKWLRRTLVFFGAYLGLLMTLVSGAAITAALATS